MYINDFAHICMYFYVFAYSPLGLVGKAKAGSSCLTWTVWVLFLPFSRRRVPALLIISIN